MEEEDTAEEAADFTVAVAAVVDFMEAEEGFTAVEASPVAATLSSEDTRMAGIVAAAITVVAAVTMAVAAVTDGAAEATGGAAEVGAMATAGAGEAGVGAGDLDTAGPIGDMAGDIRMATTATARITRPMVIILTPTADLRIT
jgi:hypothetical protein